jgi:hypothetical protein
MEDVVEGEEWKEENENKKDRRKRKIRPSEISHVISGRHFVL